MVDVLVSNEIETFATAFLESRTEAKPVYFPEIHEFAAVKVMLFPLTVVTTLPTSVLFSATSDQVTVAVPVKAHTVEISKTNGETGFQEIVEGAVQFILR